MNRVQSLDSLETVPVNEITAITKDFTFDQKQSSMFDQFAQNRRFPLSFLLALTRDQIEQYEEEDTLQASFEYNIMPKYREHWTKLREKMFSPISPKEQKKISAAQRKFFNPPEVAP